MKEKYEESPDVLFIIESFQKILSELKSKIYFNKSYNIEKLKTDIYKFDIVMYEWRSNLPHKIDNSDTLIKNKNDIYDVLFSLLQTLYGIIEDSNIDNNDETDNEKNINDDSEINN